MRKIKIVLVILGLTAIFSYNNAIAIEIWVSTSGSDRNPGTKEQPMKTLLMAMRKARELRRLNDPAVKEGVHIILGGGVYRLYEPVLIRPEDSGSESSPTIIRAASGEKPVLSGGKTVGNWEKVMENIERLPGEAQGRVWATDIPSIWSNQLNFRQW